MGHRIPSAAIFRDFALRQRNALKRADHVVGTFLGKKAFVVARAEVPVIALIIFVPIKPPDAAHYNQTTDPIVPVIADVVKTQICSGIRALETGMIVNHYFRQPDWFPAWLAWPFGGGAGVIAERAKFPFRINHAAIVGR